MPEYIKKMLTVIPDGIFLPVSIFDCHLGDNQIKGSSDDGKEANYVSIVSDATGFIPLSDAGHMLTAERVYIYLEKILKAFKRMSEYMINPSDLVLTNETIFVGEGDEVRILFLPHDNEGQNGEITEISKDTGGTKCEFSKTINAIVKEILIGIGAENISRDLHSYINATIEILERNASISDLYAHIIKLRREAKLCGIR
ncbi:MAG: hypothetical protein IK059_03355 [Firmicutes bacterium]|nr:hypothetical protein [Bacillota bacterium]